MVGLVQSMPKLGVEPNVVNYNTAIRALGRAGDLKRVAEMFSLMRSRGLERICLIQLPPRRASLV